LRVSVPVDKATYLYKLDSVTVAVDTFARLYHGVTLHALFEIFAAFVLPDGQRQ
jgi:hypothetical protein